MRYCRIQQVAASHARHRAAIGIRTLLGRFAGPSDGPAQRPGCSVWIARLRIVPLRKEFTVFSTLRVTRI
jgi:hypothetical protein